MPAATKLVSSPTPRRSAMSRNASRRSLPRRISWITRPNSRAKSLSHFSFTLAMAASKPKPASTQMVSRSRASGMARKTEPLKPVAPGDQIDEEDHPAEKESQDKAEHQEYRRIQVHRVPGHFEPAASALQGCLRREPRGNLPDLVEKRQDDPLEEVLRELDLLQGHRFLADAELGQSVLNRVLRLGGVNTDDDQDDRQHDRPYKNKSHSTESSHVSLRFVITTALRPIPGRPVGPALEWTHARTLSP